MSKELDSTMNMATAKLTSAAPKRNIPWQLVVSAVISLLKGCGGDPTPAEARARLADAGPFLRIKLARKLMKNGMNFRDSQYAVDAACKAANEATDDEAAQFLVMASSADIED